MTHALEMSWALAIGRASVLRVSAARKVSSALAALTLVLATCVHAQQPPLVINLGVPNAATGSPRGCAAGSMLSTTRSS